MSSIDVSRPEATFETSGEKQGLSERLGQPSPTCPYDYTNMSKVDTHQAVKPGRRGTPKHGD